MFYLRYVVHILHMFCSCVLGLQSPPCTVDACCANGVATFLLQGILDKPSS